jgi:DnaJ-class molecular chaperone
VRPACRSQGWTDAAGDAAKQNGGKVMSGNQEKQPGAGTESGARNPGDEASPGASQTGENVCRACKGTGQIDGKPCPECGSTGKVVENIGDA